MNSTQTNIPQEAVSARDPLLVSVVIPAYNAASYIALTLNSVLAQTLANYEIIVVNDGSADTPALEEALRPYLTKVRYIKQDNRGPSAARNAGIREARGKYVAFLDSDDLWLPHHLERQVNALEQDPSLGLIYANGVLIEGNLPVGISFENSLQSGPPTLEALLREQCTVTTSSTVASRHALIQAGLFDEALNRCEDFDLWLRMAHSGVRMAYTRERQICHRLANGLASNPGLMKRGRIQAYEKISRAQPLTEEQNRIIQRKITEIEVEIQVDFAKEALLNGQFDDALRAAEKAHSVVPSTKLWLAEIGLHYFPSLTRQFYRHYVRSLERRRRSRRARSLKESGFPVKPIDFNASVGHGGPPETTLAEVPARLEVGMHPDTSAQSNRTGL